MGLDSVRVSLSRNLRSVRSCEKRRHAVSKFSKAVSMKMLLEDRKSNFVAEVKK